MRTFIQWDIWRINWPYSTGEKWPRFGILISDSHRIAEETLLFGYITKKKKPEMLDYAVVIDSTHPEFHLTGLDPYVTSHFYPQTPEIIPCKDIISPARVGYLGEALKSEVKGALDLWISRNQSHRGGTR